MTTRNLRLPFKSWPLSGACMIDDELLAGTDQGSGGAEPPSLHEALTAAFETDAKSQEAADPAAGTDAAAQAQASADAARVRDNQGRFTKAADQASSITTEPKTPQAPAEPPAAQQQATIGPPPTWSATAKADWDKLPEHIQREVLKREGDIQQGKAQWDQKADRFNRLDAVLSPRRERFQMAGIDEAQAVQALLAAQDFLERSPLDGIAYLARQYGVDLRQFAQRAPGGQQPPQGGVQQLPPELQRLASEVQTLKSTLAQQQQSAEQATRAGVLDQVQQFSADPANVYFENVKAEMGKLLKAEAASDLKDAYDKACWANPEIRGLLLRQQEEQRVAQAREQASAKAAAARHASGSVTGSPAPGATPVSGSQGSTIRENLEAAFREHAA